MNCTNTAKQSTPNFQVQKDLAIMATIRNIVNRGSNVEIKKKKDGTLTVMEVKKHIVE